MTAPPDDTTTDLHDVIAALRAERDAAVAREAKRDSDYAERAAHQGATVEVLQAMAASPGDAKPVFDLIVRRARDLCDAYGASLAQVVDGSIVLRAYVYADEAEAKGHEAAFPRPVAEDTMFGRTILARGPVQLPNVGADQTYALREGTLRGAVRAQAAVPLMRHGDAIGAINMTRQQTGEFLPAQIELLQTFAEQAVIAINSAETYRALQERTAALATRNSEYGERIEHQAATIDVLKVMSASPGDPQPAFELIVRRARELCNSAGAGIAEYDGVLVHQRSLYGDSSGFSAEYIASFPMRPTRGSIPCRAILDKRIIHIRNMDIEPELLPIVRHLRVRSVLSIPLLRDGAAIGAFTIHANQSGGFSDSQVALLQTFAEQAVIAITSAETYRALQTRTSDLQQSLEYQTATSDVLNVISRSTFDLQPVLSTVAETAARLCVADQAALVRHEGGMLYLAANWGFPPEYEARMNEIGSLPVGADAQTVSHRAIIERRVIHIPDVAAVPGYPDGPIRLGRQRTSLGVPLLREGEPVGLILLARQRVEPFTERQIELVRTFADQAVIAIENTRLLNEQQEALERQTAMAEVLAVINANPGKLGPVFDMILEKAHRLCDIGMGALVTCEAGQCRAVVTRGYSPEADAHARRLRPIPDNLAALAKSGEVLHDPDVSRADSPLSGDFGRTFIALTGAHTYLVVPLRKAGALLGTITAVRREVRPFTERQITLLKNFAAQAVNAMENARLITEQREALEQQTATAEVLRVINASPGDLAPVFDAMLEKAMRLCGAAIGGIYRYNGQGFDTVALLGVTPAFQEYDAKYPMVKIQPGSMPARMIEARGPVQNPDVPASEVYRAGSPYARALVALGGIRAVLDVPLLKEGALLGFIAIYREAAGAFSDKQIALLENFAAQAVIAMENARLITEQREALEQQTATADVLRVINTSPGDLVPVFDAILDKAHSLCGATVGTLSIYKDGSFHAVATHGYPEQVASLMLHPAAPNAYTRELIRGERFHQIEDLRAIQISPDYLILRALVEHTDVRTVLFVPLRKDGALLGFISVNRPEVRPFSEKEIALLENFGDQAVIAMENARLLTEQREALEQQTATAEVLGVINASPGNLAPVFDAILDKALHLCEAPLGGLAIYDGETFYNVAKRGAAPAYADILYAPIRPGFALDRLVRGEEFVQVADITTDDLSDSPRRRAFAEIGARTAIWIALRRDKAVVGMIDIYRKEVRPFTGKQIALLQNFAAQAVIAMDNARLLDEIRQRQEELRVTFENMGDGVAMFDEAQHLVAWNRKFQDILDVPDDIIARRQTFSEYVRYLAERGEYGPEADPEEHVRRLIEQAGQSRTYERTRPDGRVIEIRHNPVPGGGFVLIYADITERKQNEAEIRAARDAAEEASRTIEAAYRDLKAAQANLIQAEKMASLGQLTAGIAHEIKNPLNFVNNFSALSTELIDELRDVLAPEPLGETARTEVDDLTALLKGNLEKVVQHGQRADGIVKSMLDHSRGSSGERRMVDLNTLTDEALNLAYHGARAQDQSFNITLERDFGDGIAPIEVNPQDMTRVFLNLFVNGFYAVTRRARSDGDARFVPTLMVTTVDAGEVVEIRVRDNGTGIPADIRDKLFQPFFTTKPTGEGTGLGLSITYDIVTQQHGGHIAVDSKVGEYSEFTIRLPRKP